MLYTLPWKPPLQPGKSMSQWIVFQWIRFVEESESTMLLRLSSQGIWSILRGLGLGWHPMVIGNRTALGSTYVGDPSFPRNLSWLLHTATQEQCNAGIIQIKPCHSPFPFVFPATLFAWVTQICHQTLMITVPLKWRLQTSYFIPILWNPCRTLMWVCSSCLRKLHLVTSSSLYVYQPPQWLIWMKMRGFLSPWLDGAIVLAWISPPARTWGEPTLESFPKCK